MIRVSVSAVVSELKRKKDAELVYEPEGSISPVGEDGVLVERRFCVRRDGSRDPGCVVEYY